MRSADVYCAPNTGGESFGIVLVEAMAAGTPVVASDLDAFRRVLEDGAAGRLVPVDDSAALASALIEVLSDDAVRERYAAAAATAVRRYDWSVVARQIQRVYETVAGAGSKVRVAGSAGSPRKRGSSEATRGSGSAGSPRKRGSGEATRGSGSAGSPRKRGSSEATGGIK
jgi:phosphatidylinositol alpha-mannosyltransferase